MASPLLEFRKRHDLTQAQAADMLGVGESTWRQMEGAYRGRQLPRQWLKHLQALDRLAVAGLALDDDSGDEKPWVR